MFNLPYIVDDLPRHDTLKDRVLEMIEKEKGSTIRSHGEKISNADWNEDNSLREYIRIIYPVVNMFVSKHFRRMNYNEHKVGKMWFQQYETSDYHSWHRHNGSDWNFVYYLELPEDAPPTEFRNPLNKDETFMPEVKEGQCILFPAILEHRSNVNLSKNRKTIIAMNFTTF
jgi:Putative 2OG-Fe(II) oxygenase